MSGDAIEAAVDVAWEHEVAFLKAMVRAPSDNPPGDCASTSQASDIGADRNHLCPVRLHASPSRVACVVLARTSEPPCFSVMPMPTSTERFSRAGILRGS